MKQTETFQMLSDETRLRVLALMCGECELCVCELVYALEISQPKISRHLAALRDAGLLTSRRDAQWMFYYKNLELVDWQKDALRIAVTSIQDEPQVARDKARLDEMKNRPQRNDAA